ncbi:hypothetical protein [Hymenobacter ruricola]|uniref:Uncharacterized protein n=1 Tax=Hymenobacter ruricola TaxID=2791023 RepID=A0ABS0I952_9BACT|nr:hypothetical protein [Hymenobacter ruricola]MBF9223486.1 hypothetical protein [Hymenobacter ruricola]
MSTANYLIAALSWLLLLPVASCGQTKAPVAAGPAVARANLPAPKLAVDVFGPATPSFARQLADGSRLFLGVNRADNHNVPGLARYRPDGLLDTAFCRRVAQVVPHCYKVLEAKDGKLWVHGSGSASFGAFDPPYIVRLNVDGTADGSFPKVLCSGFNAWCMLPDGRLLLGGQYLTLGQPQQLQGYLACLRPDGTLDADFMAAAGNEQGGVSALACQRDGRILVAGQGLRPKGQPAAVCSLLRLTSSGQPDPGFQVLPHGSQPLMALAVQADDKLLVLLGRGVGTLLRLLPNGAPDPTFILRLRQPFHIINGQPPLLALSDGRILFPGHVSEKPPTTGAPWRSLLCVSAIGVEDTTFRYRAQPSWVWSLQELPGGQVLAATSLVCYPTVPAARLAPTAVVVLQPDGAPLAGQVPPLLGQPASVDALAVQPDGRLLLGGGFTGVGNTPARGLARLNLDGTPDTAFARRCPTDGFVWRIAVEANGRILVAGTFGRIGNLRQPTLARLLPDGRPDSTFRPPLAPWTETGSVTLQGIGVQADGKVLISGHLQLTTGKQHKLLRLTTAGQPDATFQPPGTSEEAGPLLVQPDGKILVASSPVLLRRLLPGGAIDPDFAVIRHSGIVTALVQCPDGRLLVGGSFQAGGFSGVPSLKTLARLLPNGSADPDFHPLMFSFSYVNGLGIGPDGRILVGGSGNPEYQDHRPPPYFKLLRLLNQGPPDPTFNPRSGPNGEVNALVVCPNGTAFIGGGFASFDEKPHFGLGRLPAPPPVGTGQGANRPKAPLKSGKK